MLFSNANKNQLKEVIEYVEEYIGESPRPVVQQMMKNNFRAFSKVNKSKLQEVIEYVEEYMGESSKPVVQQMMKNNLFGFFQCQ